MIEDTAQFMKEPIIDWASDLTPSVIAGQTTRHAPTELFSKPPFSQFNLALHVGDTSTTVQQQRIALLKLLQPVGAKRLVWLEQTHSTKVYVAKEHVGFLPVNADAVVTTQTGVACMIMTADCLPIILSDATGQEVACIHAGWRGLLNGIIENTLQNMQQPVTQAWFGAAIGATSFEVGQEVYAAFMQQNVNSESAFVPLNNTKYLAQIYQLARLRLAACGIAQVSGGEQDTFLNAKRYYSYRKQAQTGRMASFVMIRPN